MNELEKALWPNSEVEHECAQGCQCWYARLLVTEKRRRLLWQALQRNARAIGLEVHDYRFSGGKFLPLNNEGERNG